MNLESCLESCLESIVLDKVGIEIGGPSPGTGIFIYQNANSMDNVVFSSDTVWAKQINNFKYLPNKTGNLIINDAVDINLVKDEVYDFCFSSHCLEHIANPLKAVSEWLRIIKKNGYLILVLPNKHCCFDHNRNYSEFQTLLKQCQNNVGEDDLSTLDEILQLHDLSMDGPAGTPEQFMLRSLNNYNNRCLHHYVYSPDLLLKICNYFECEFIYTITKEVNIWFIMKKK